MRVVENEEEFELPNEKILKRQQMLYDGAIY
jgi:hypothetical protein